MLLWLASLLVFCMICSPLAKEADQKKEDETTESAGKDNKGDLSTFKDTKINKEEDYIYEKISECKFFAVCFDRKGSLF